MHACRRTAASGEPTVRSQRLRRDLFDVVRQAKELPLRAHPGLAAQREAAPALVVPDVREHRLRRRHAPALQVSALRCVDGVAQLLARVVDVKQCAATVVMVMSPRYLPQSCTMRLEVDDASSMLVASSVSAFDGSHFEALQSGPRSAVDLANGPLPRKDDNCVRSDQF